MTFLVLKSYLIEAMFPFLSTQDLLLLKQRHLWSLQHADAISSCNGKHGGTSIHLLRAMELHSVDVAR